MTRRLWWMDPALDQPMHRVPRDIGGGSSQTTTSSSNIPEKTATELEADELTLKQLRRQDSLSERYDPVVQRYLDDLANEQRVRSGGRVTNVMRDIKGATAGKTVEQFISELRESGRFTTTTPGTKATAAAGEYDYFAAVPAQTQTEATPDIVKIDDAAVAAEANRLLKAQKPWREVDTAATDAIQKRYQDVIDRETNQQKNADRLAAIDMELSEANLAAVKRGGAATPEQIALINEATGAAQKTGEADIDRFTKATLRQINEEVASASGLRPTDTPVVRLSERAGEEATRQQGILTSKLAETNAMARLNFPLAAQKLTSDIALSQESIGTATQNFQAQLQQRAQDNRFRLFQANPTGTFGTSSAGFGSSLAQHRIGSASRTSTSETDSGMSLMDIGKGAGGVGSFLSAGAKLGMFAL